LAGVKFLLKKERVFFLSGFCPPRLRRGFGRQASIRTGGVQMQFGRGKAKLFLREVRKRILGVFARSERDGARRGRGNFQQKIIRDRICFASAHSFGGILATQESAGGMRGAVLVFGM